MRRSEKTRVEIHVRDEGSSSEESSVETSDALARGLQVGELDVDLSLMTVIEWSQHEMTRKRRNIRRDATNLALLLDLDVRDWAVLSLALGLEVLSEVGIPIALRLLLRREDVVDEDVDGRLDGDVGSRDWNHGKPRRVDWRLRNSVREVSTGELKHESLPSSSVHSLTCRRRKRQVSRAREDRRKGTRRTVVVVETFGPVSVVGVDNAGACLNEGKVRLVGSIGRSRGLLVNGRDSD